MEKNQLIVLILLFSGLSLLVAVFLIAVFLVQRSKANRFLLETKLRQQQYEKALLQTQIEVQEETRKTIGVELHDNIGQLLSLTNLTIATVNLNNIAQTEQKLEDARGLIKRSIHELRRLSKVLHGDSVLREGLEQAIQDDVHWLQRTGNWAVTFIILNELGSAVNKEKDLFIFRLFQECLNNIIKHAAATVITITIDYQSDLLSLQLLDNGVGFELSTVRQNKSGIGLANIDMRVKLMKGKMTIRSQPGAGTTIDFSIPYP